MSHSEPKILTPAQAPALVVGGTEARIVKFEMTIEASVTNVLGKPVIDRVRTLDSSGKPRWIPAKTWIRRLQALGIDFEAARAAIGPAGTHTPGF